MYQNLVGTLKFLQFALMSQTRPAYYWKLQAIVREVIKKRITNIFHVRDRAYRNKPMRARI